MWIFHFFFFFFFFFFKIDCLLVSFYQVAIGIHLFIKIIIFIIIFNI